MLATLEQSDTVEVCHRAFQGQASTVLFSAFHRCKAGDPAKAKLLRDRLCRLNMNLARKIAHRMTGQCAEAYEDLEQIAAIGLLKAIDRYDPDKGAAFSSFAVPYIQGEIRHYLRDHWGQVKIPRRAVELSSKIKKIRRRLTELGRPMEEHAIAAALGVNQAKWRWTQEALERQPLLNLDDVQPVVEATYQPTDSDPQWQQVLYKRLDAVESPYRTVLIEAYFAGLSVGQIAQRHQSDAFQIRAWLQTGLQLMTHQEKAHA